MMEENERVLNFASLKADKIQIIKDAIEKKEYWKALRLLNSLMQENRDIDVLMLAYDLHSRLIAYVGITDDLISLLVSNNADAILIGAKGLISFAGDDKVDNAKTYYDFAKEKLKPFVEANSEAVFDQLLAYTDKTKSIHFVEKQDRNRKAVEKIDKLLNDGEFEEIQAIANGSIDGDRSLINKMTAESFLVEKKYKQALEVLNRVDEKDRDIYFECLKFRAVNNLKKEKKSDAQTLINHDIKYPEELIFVSEALFEAGEPKKVIELIEKNEDRFEFYYPMYFAKGIAFLNIKEQEKAALCFKNTYIINPRQVAAKELAMLIENGKKISSKISIHGVFPSEVIKSVDSKYKKIMKLTDLEFSRLSIGKIEEMLYWLELYHNEFVLEQFLARLIYYKNGIEAIKHVLLSFQSTDWLKKQCIRILVFSGADDVNIYFTNSNTLKSVRLLMPEILLGETEISKDGLFSENISYNRIMLAYSTAYSELSFENQKFEKRLQEVADCLIKQMIAEFSKNKSDKISINLISAAILYAACSNATGTEFKNKKVNNSRFSTFDTAASQFEVSSEELKKFVKQIF